MNYGEKLTKLKDSLGIKHWTKYGEIVSVPGGWLADQSKKESVQIVDIPRLIKIVEYHHISLDYLLKDNIEESAIVRNDNLLENDIIVMIDNIQKQLNEKNVCFNGYTMNKECKNITSDSLEILKEFIKSNL